MSSGGSSETSGHLGALATWSTYLVALSFGCDGFPPNQYTQCPDVIGGDATWSVLGFGLLNAPISGFRTFDIGGISLGLL